MVLSLGLNKDQMFHILWNTVANPFLLLDEKGLVSDSNPAAKTMLGDMHGQSFSHLIVDPFDVDETLHQCIHGKTELQFDAMSLKMPNNTVLNACLHFFPFEESQTSFVLVNIKTEALPLEILEKIARLNDERIEKLRQQMNLVSSELLLKTIQLAEEKNKLSTVVEGISEGFIGFDQQGKIIHCNQAAKEILNLHLDKIEIHTFDQLCPAIADQIGFDPHVSRKVIKQRFDVTYDGKEIQVYLSPLSDDKQNVIGFVLIIYDRSKEAELDKMKSDLISIVSHELRSPLTSIKGYVDLMLGGDLGIIPDNMKSYLAIVSANANRLATLIEDMLDLSRIESGKLNMTFGKVDVKYLCDYVFLTLKPQAEMKKIDYKLEVCPGLAVSGDVDRLQQVLTNLVSNAIKYTPEGGVVRINASRNDQNILIAVQDDGIGISEEDRKKLFQRFFRVKNAKTRNIGGTGLGLCIAKSIVEAHDGHIRVESEPDKGSTFIIVLHEYHQ